MSQPKELCGTPYYVIIRQIHTNWTRERDEF